MQAIRRLITAFFVIIAFTGNCQVPDTETFSLQDVVDAVSPSSNDLQTCFDEANSDGFDPDYEEDKNELDDFRNYHHVQVQQLTSAPNNRYFYSIGINPDDHEIYLVGGYDSNTNVYHNVDVYNYSNDSWITRAATNMRDIRRDAFVTSDEYLYHIAGDDYIQFSNDNATEEIGDAFYPQTSSTDFPDRVNHRAEITDYGWMYVVGGADPSTGTEKNDVWYSTDNGKTWDLLYGENAPWPARRSHGLVSVGSQHGLLVAGGLGGDGYSLNDVWYREDPATGWNQQTSSAEWSPRRAFGFVKNPSNGNVYLLGGYVPISGNRGEIWKSTDNGKTWTKFLEHSSLERYWFDAVIVNGTLYYGAGYDYNGNALNSWYKIDL